MAEEQPNIPNENTPPPGSSESFNQFKDRILSAMGDISDSNNGHNTVVVTHSKPIKTINGWEHAGYPEDDSLHQATYDKDPSAGSHTELDANTVAALRTRNAVIPPGGRKEGAITQWIESQGNKIKSDIEDIFKHPENIVGPGMMKGPKFSGGFGVHEMPERVPTFDIVEPANTNYTPKEQAEIVARHKEYQQILKTKNDMIDAEWPKIVKRGIETGNPVDPDLYKELKRLALIKDTDSRAMLDNVWGGRHPLEIEDIGVADVAWERLAKIDKIAATINDLRNKPEETMSLHRLIRDSKDPEEIASYKARLEEKARIANIKWTDLPPDKMENPTQPQQSQHFGVTPKSSEWTQDEFGNLVRTLASEPIDYKAPVGDRAKVKSEELLNRIQKLFDQGLKHSEVADSLGINRKTLSSIQSRNATRDRPLGKKPKQ